MKVFLTTATENYHNQITPIKRIYNKIIELGNKHTNTYATNTFSKEKIIENEKVDLKIHSSILKSDLLIAEISIPAFGVGYNIALAKLYEIPILCLYHKKWKKNVPTFISNSSSHLFHIVEYSDTNLEEVLETSIGWAIPKKTRFNMNLNKQENMDLKYLARKANMSRTELIHKLIADEAYKHINDRSNFVDN